LNFSGESIIDVNIGLRDWYEYDNDEMYFQYLGITNNSLTEIPPKLFQSLKYLGGDRNYRLNLSNNQITTIPRLSIRSIDLSNNKITEIETGAFSGLQVRSINLNGNQITTIPAGVFAGLPIENISLGNNKITKIETGAFAGLTTPDNYSDYYRYIGLWGNQLSDLPVGVFSGLSGRISIDL
jgi:Leucine-rich repeat (LRR) protein